MEQDSELLLLNTIHEYAGQQKEISQRDLSRAINMSLGMTNVLVKRLTHKGLIVMKKVSARNVTYVLTPDGMNELAKRTYRYLKRTMKQVVVYKEAVFSLAQKASGCGYTALVVLGESDIEFIVEYAAGRLGMEFHLLSLTADIPEGSFVFISETVSDIMNDLPESGCVYIRNLFREDR